MVEIKVDGLDSLMRALHELPDRVAKNALRSAVNAGATEIKRGAREKAPVDTGRLKRSLYQRQIREQSSLYQQTYFVGVRTGPKRGKDGKKDYSQDAWYWKFVEFGTSKIVARPFLRPAFEGNKEAAVNRIAEKLDERIQKYATELAKK